jgi:hypothetical protein
MNRVSGFSGGAGNLVAWLLDSGGGTPQPLPITQAESDAITERSASENPVGRSS